MLLSNATGMPKKSIRRRSASGSGYLEQDINPAKLRKLQFTPSIVHQHTKGTPFNLDLLSLHGILPIVQTRHVADSILSLHDHIERESSEIPLTYVPQSYAAMRYEERLSFLINSTMPWYLAFFSSWKEAATSHKVLWTSYEKLFADQQREIGRIATFCGLRLSSEDVSNTISEMDQVFTRKNVGITGRGHSLSDLHKQMINDHANSWPLAEEDQKILGLPI